MVIFFACYETIGCLFLRKLNFVFKLLIIFFFLFFSLFLKSIYYNLVLIGVLLLVFRYGRFSLFNLKGQGFRFFVFLSLIFVSQVFVGSGKILFRIWDNFFITWQGVTHSIYFVSQIFLIYACIQLLLTSTPDAETGYYLRKIQSGRNRFTRMLSRFARLLWFVLRQTPRYLSLYGGWISLRRKQAGGEKGSLAQRAGALLEMMYQFFIRVLLHIEKDYPEFLEAQQQGNGFRPRPFITAPQAWVSAGLVVAHLLFLWNMLIR